jgi:hypothetical protein
MTNRLNPAPQVVLVRFTVPVGEFRTGTNHGGAGKTRTFDIVCSLC